MKKRQTELSGTTRMRQPTPGFVALALAPPSGQGFSRGQRLRTVRTKGSGSRTACLTMVFKLAQCAEKCWRRLNGQELLPEVIRGVKFVDGIKEIAA